MAENSERLRADGPIRIAILEDHRLMREVLCSALASQGFEIDGAGDPAHFFRCIEEHLPDLAIVDLTLEQDGVPEPADGFTVLRQMRELYPSVRLLVFSATSSQTVVDKAFRMGAQGYLFKSSTTLASLGQAIERLMSGHRVSPSDFPSLRTAGARLNGSGQEGRVRLTERERQVLNLVASGASNQTIAAKLQIKERTVKAHVSSLYRKLGSENRVELALFAQTANMSIEE
jgi:two-component system, NarL family, nitrate/nitrite response regulator NarL